MALTPRAKAWLVGCSVAFRAAAIALDPGHAELAGHPPSIASIVRDALEMVGDDDALLRELLPPLEAILGSANN